MINFKLTPKIMLETLIVDIHDIADSFAQQHSAQRVINFLGADFADVRRLDPMLLEQGRQLIADEDFSEGLQRTVIGMAAGMSPLRLAPRR